jgi:hypothetical protein
MHGHVKLGMKKFTGAFTPILTLKVPVVTQVLYLG